jgi:E3 Ubiquitin ligase
MDPGTLLFAALSTTVVAGTSVVAYLGSELRLRRTLRRTPRWSLAALPEDTFGRVTGAAHAFEGQQLTAPLTGRPCVYFIAIVEQRGTRDGNRARWTRLALERRSVRFVLEDAGHRAIVDPRRARVTLDFDHVYRTAHLPRALQSPSDRAPGAAPTTEQRQGQFLARHHLVNHNWSRMIELRYREAVIEVAEKIAVLGSGIREPDLEARPDGDAYRAAGGTRLRMTGSRRYPLIISDAPSTL